VFRSWLLNNPKLNPYRLSIDPGFFRVLTGMIRTLPNFLIIGAAKCGTTSLYDYLVQHPCIFSASRKEIGFFDDYFNMGLFWYRTHFPTSFKKFLKKLTGKQNFLTGEASANYLFHPHAAKRIFNTIPSVKLIVLLRNPVDRAYSFYNMQVKKGLEKLSFEEAIKSEEKRLEGEKEKILQNENYYSYNYAIYSYLARGIYVDQLKDWMKFFPNNQFLILHAKDLQMEPFKTINIVFEFLGLPHYEIKNLQKKNVGEYNQMNTDIRKWLIDYFKPHNEKLYKLLNRDFGWDN